MPTETHPFDSKIEWSANGSSYTELTDAASITLPQLERAVVNRTHLRSPDKYREKRPGWRDSGDIGFTAYFTKAQFNTLLSHFNDEVIRYYRITFPLIEAEVSASNWVGQGFITNVGQPEISEGSDEEIMCEVQIAITGKMAFTPGT